MRRLGCLRRSRTMQKPATRQKTPQAAQLWLSTGSPPMRKPAAAMAQSTQMAALLKHGTVALGGLRQHTNGTLQQLKALM